ncbi:hypothetical protein Q3G72_018965 [Acer saccharum]|nr:hypothetical protein Q3G72_018965 [Acer saccharum]
MDVEYLLNYPGENEATSDLLSDEQIIENVMGNDKEDEVEEDSSCLIKYVVLLLFKPSNDMRFFSGYDCCINAPLPCL